MDGCQLLRGDGENVTIFSLHQSQNDFSQRWMELINRYKKDLFAIKALLNINKVQENNMLFLHSLPSPWAAF